ncbi:MAG: hypothetical protein Q4P71_09070 [Actinomycetaceae bacterium]|nr:hypothetical protein [Actinomycetaceae bacterium]
MSLSKTRIRKIGSIIRAYSREQCTHDEYQRALADLDTYRGSMVQNMLVTHHDLRNALTNLELLGNTSYRLKRQDTIVDKLQRQPQMNLARMRDIAGCRVVLQGDSLAELNLLNDYVSEFYANCEPRKIDYVNKPRRSGYRALHIEITRHGLPLEIQLRTESMHDWAQQAEALSSVVHINLKEDGDTRLHNLLQEYAALLADKTTSQSGLQTGYDQGIEQIRKTLDELVMAFSDHGGRSTNLYDYWTGTAQSERRSDGH